MEWEQGPSCNHLSADLDNGVFTNIILSRNPDGIGTMCVYIIAGDFGWLTHRPELEEAPGDYWLIVCINICVFAGT